MTARGLVAAGDPQTARAGAQLLKGGGHAIDAVCAAAFASLVCEPLLTSAGGAGVLLHGAPDRPWSVLDFFARVPGLGGQPDKLDFHEILIDFGPTTQAFHVGRAAVAVPGALRGLLEAHRRYGRLPLGDVLAPAIALARDGYRVSACHAHTCELLSPIVRLTPPTLALIGIDGRLPRAGETTTSPGQARFFESLISDPDGTIRAVESDMLAAFGPAQGGLLSKEDLAQWRPVEREPIRVPFAGHAVLLNPPPSSGGVLVAFGLRALERRKLLDQGFGHHWADLAETLRAMDSVRSRYDYDRWRAPGFVASLLSDDSVDAAWATRGGPPAKSTRGSTTHISVLDGQGGAAALTMSNGEGCGHTLSHWGLHLNNFLGEEDINPNGFHAQPPGSRMTTMMCPTVVLKDERPILALGSGGSNRIRSALLQALVNYLGFRRPLPAAITDDRLHVEGDRLWFEATDMDERAVNALQAGWSKATRFGARNMFFGGVHAAAEEAGADTGFGDPRRGGATCRPHEI